MANEAMFAYHFVDYDLGIEIFLEKQERTEKGGIDSEIGDWGTSHTYVWAEKISSRACLLFVVF